MCTIVCQFVVSMFSHGVVSLFSIYKFECPSGIFRPAFNGSEIQSKTVPFYANVLLSLTVLLLKLSAIAMQNKKNNVYRTCVILLFDDFETGLQRTCIVSSTARNIAKSAALTCKYER